MTGKLYLIDGHALIFKMYYAFLAHPMINSKGADTSILFGFTKYLLELISKAAPSHLAVAFDPPGGTFRNKLYPDYKANRGETPQLVIDALEPLQDILSAMDIPVLMKSGYEADDVIGTVAKALAGEQLPVYMVTPDKDYGQLVDRHIFQLKPGKNGEDQLLDEAAVCSKYGISTPSQVIEMLTICGDSSDNVPGVKGVGDVGAAKLIARYGDVEGIYAHLDELPVRQQAMFEQARSHIRLSHELVTIKTDVPVEARLEDMALGLVLTPGLANLFEYYEMRSLLKFFGKARTPSKPDPSSFLPASPSAAPSAAVLTQPSPLQISQSGLSEVLAAARAGGDLSLLAESSGSGVFAAADRLNLAAGDNPILVTSSRFPLPPEAVQLLGDPRICKWGSELKPQLNMLENMGVKLGGRLCDTALMHYLIDPEKSHKTDVLAAELLGVSLETVEEGSDSPGLFDGPLPETDRRRECAVSLALGRKLSTMLGSAETLYDNMEEPLTAVLAQMERDGVKVDVSVLEQCAAGMAAEASSLEAAIREEAGEPALNVGSPKQVGELLFGKMRIDPKVKKSKSGSYSTDETTLQYYTEDWPIVGKILEYRAIKKLLGTYIEPFPSYISPLDAKVHTTFNQALTATGRLSSSNPNLQNIPVRTGRGKEIRKAFVPSLPGGIIVSADYSQIELRIMAHLCQDSHLLEAFRTGLDVHAATAAKIFGIPVDMVSREQRGIAKTANFGIMYGISSFGLAQRLGLPRTQAKKIIDDYFEAFPSIRTYIDRTVAKARETGWVETIFGRRRYLPEINSRNQNLRALAERNAINAPIQGTSADIIKLAMVAVGRRLREEGLESRMVLQIHDELLFDALPGEYEKLRALVVDAMENIVHLSVPLTVECNYGKNWLEAH